MPRLLKATAILCIILICSVNPLPGSLSDFDKDVKREQQENKNKKHSSAGTQTENYDSNDDFPIFFYIIAFFVYMNLQVKGYTSFPYSDGDFSNFVVFKMHDSSETTNTDAEAVIPINAQETHSTSSFYLAADTGGQYAYSNGMAYFMSVTGRFWKYIGPEFGYKRFWDGDEILETYAAGLNVPLVQTSGFTLEFYAQGAWMRGVTRLNGCIVGMAVRSFPIRPLVIQGRYGHHIYDNIEFNELEGRIGLIVWRVEFFGGYHYLKSEHARIEGPIFGIRIWI